MFKTVVSIASLPFFLLGCAKEVTLDEACASLDGFCEVISADSNCRRERENMVMTAYKIEVADDNSKSLSYVEDLQYQQLNYIENYKKCAYLQSLIEYKPAEIRFANTPKLPSGEYSEENKKKISEYKKSKIRLKQSKIRNYREASNYLTILSRNTKESNHPYLLYWHWSKHQDQRALQKLVLAYEKGKVQEYDLIYYIGESFARIDIAKTKSLLLKSLSKYPSGLYTAKGTEITKNMELNASFDDDGRLHYRILRGLVQLYFKEEKYNSSYVLARVLKLNNDRSVDVDMIIEYMQEKDMANADRLDDIADDVHKDLKNGDFLPSTYSEFRT
jgi:hypothetical protein